MKVMNSKIMVLWAFLIVMLLSVLLLLGYIKRDKVYLEFEKKVEKATLVYISDNKIKVETEKATIVFINELVEKEYLKDEEENIKKYCVESVNYTKGLIKDKFKLNKNCKKEE